MTEPAEQRQHSTAPPLPARDYAARNKQQERRNGGEQQKANAASSAESGSRTAYKQSISIESSLSTDFENDSNEHFNRIERRSERRPAPSSDLVSRAPVAQLTEADCTASQVQKPVTGSCSCGSLNLRSVSSSKSTLSLSASENPTSGLLGDGKEARSGSNASVLTDSDDWCLVPSDANSEQPDVPQSNAHVQAAPESSRKRDVLRFLTRKKKKPVPSESLALMASPASQHSPQTPQRPAPNPPAVSPIRTPPAVPPRPAAIASRVPNVRNPAPATSYTPLSVDTGPHMVSNAQMANYLVPQDASPQSEQDFAQYLAAHVTPSTSRAPPHNSHPALVHAHTLPGTQYSAMETPGAHPNRHIMIPNGLQVPNSAPQLRSVVSVPGNQPPNATAYFLGLHPSAGPATAPPGSYPFPYPATTQQAALLERKQQCTNLRRQLDTDIQEIQKLRQEVNELEGRRHIDEAKTNEHSLHTFRELCAMRNENRQLAIDTQFLAYDLDMLATAQSQEAVDNTAGDMNRQNIPQGRWQSSPVLTDWVWPAHSQQAAATFNWQLGENNPQSHFAPPYTQAFYNAPAGTFMPNAPYPIAVPANQDYRSNPGGFPPQNAAAYGPNFNRYVSPAVLGDSRPHAASQPVINRRNETQQWSCSKCTFLNHPELTSCEMCNEARLQRDGLQRQA